MAEITDLFFARWFSRRHVGDARPHVFVGVRRGKFVRDYQPYTFLDGSTEDFASIPKESKGAPWWPKWTPTEDYKFIPGVRSVDISKSFEGKGTGSVTVAIENMVEEQATGALGRMYHILKRGVLAPYYAFIAPGRPAQGVAVDEDWSEVLDSEAQITVWEGYGEELLGGAFAKTFTGLIDGPLDLTSQPSTITIAARDFGQMLTDQRLFGYNKSPQLRPPITFVDSRYADKIEAVSGGAKASTQHKGHPAIYVSDLHSSTSWWSQGHSVRNVTEWVEIHIPRGRYETFYIYPEADNMEVFVSVYARGDDPKMDGSSVPTNAWIDAGLGDVPGDNGGFPYIHHFATMEAKGQNRNLGHRLWLGDNSVLRISFRNLDKSKDDDGNLTYRAMVRRLAAIRREVRAEVIKKRWIIVEDASDIVKVILRWAGFREWQVENFGWRLKDKLVFHQGDMLMDVIDKLATYGAFTFFMGDPTTHDLSTGVPTFRYSGVRKNPPLEMIQVTDADLIVGMGAHLDHGEKGAIIRARGKLSKKGVALGEDTDKRFQASYRPPWVTAGRTSGKLRHDTIYDNLLTSDAQCKVACVLLALNEALASTTATVEVPGYPGVDLDEQMSVLDAGTGVNSRLYIAERRSTHTTGRQASWKTTFTGALLDVPDIVAAREDLNEAIEAAVAEP